MRYHDLVYGDCELTEPVLLELISSPALQRLKGVDQAGYRPLWVKPETDVDGKDHSRFTHSVGVCLLLARYGAPLEEQIAGLIHDVSHSAFSHCIDYALGSQDKQDHQDRIHDTFVERSEISEILKRHGLVLKNILDDTRHPLKERDLPDLCADRIDYVLRDAVIFQELEEAEATDLLTRLIVQDKQWIFKDFVHAQKFAGIFQKMNTDYYSGLASVRMLYIVGDYLRYALQKGYVTEQDLYTTDQEVLDKIAVFLPNDKHLALLSDRLNGRVRVTNNPADYDLATICKSRAVDPLFFENGNVCRVSDKNPTWKNVVQQESKPKQYFLKFER